tara:strand:- start:518 stop:718 length:201 start_codon:yes stop_codon:yes gene_type:complete
MRTKFKILYPKDHADEAKRGTVYKPVRGNIVVMSSGGVFFLYCKDDYNSYVRLLSSVLPKYDVEWK